MKAPEGMELFVTGTGQRVWVHSKDRCTGPCPIHNPSDHHMKDWPLHWRDDRGIFERMCEHGVGHPDPDTIEFIRRIRGEGPAETEAVHGCDGCCAPPMQKPILHMMIRRIMNWVSIHSTENI